MHESLKASALSRAGSGALRSLSFANRFSNLCRVIHVALQSSTVSLRFFFGGTHGVMSCVRHAADFGAVAFTIPDMGFDLRQISEQNIHPFETAALPFPRGECAKGFRWVASLPDRASRSDVPRGDHQNIAVLVLRFDQFTKDAIEHAVFRPSPETVVERLVRALVSGGVRPLYPVPDNVRSSPWEPLAITRQLQGFSVTVSSVHQIFRFGTSAVDNPCPRGIDPVRPHSRLLAGFGLCAGRWPQYRAARVPCEPRRWR